MKYIVILISFILFSFTGNTIDVSPDTHTFELIEVQDQGKEKIFKYQIKKDGVIQPRYIQVNFIYESRSHLRVHNILREKSSFRTPESQLEIKVLLVSKGGITLNISNPSLFTYFKNKTLKKI